MEEVCSLSPGHERNADEATKLQDEGCRSPPERSHWAVPNMTLHPTYSNVCTSGPRISSGLGAPSVKAKPLHGLGGHVMEMRRMTQCGTYRARDIGVGDGTGPAAAETVEK
jgi:hypothetical protein